MNAPIRHKKSANAIDVHVGSRVELRHGTLALVRATFKGFTPALPPPRRARTWREVLKMDGFDPAQTTADMIESRFRALAKQHHPDAGGSTEAMAELNAARAAALKEIAS